MVEKRATLAAEYSVIGALLLDPKIAGELFAATRESDFLRAELRTVYTAAREIFNRGRPLDPVTIRAAIGKEYEPLLMECMDVCSTASAWKAYAEAMQEQTKVSRLRELADKLTQVRTSEEGRELIAAAMEVTAEKQGAEIVSLSQGLETFALEPTRQPPVQRLRRFCSPCRPPVRRQDGARAPDGDAHGAARESRLLQPRDYALQADKPYRLEPRDHRLRPHKLPGNDAGGVDAA